MHYKQRDMFIYEQERPNPSEIQILQNNNLPILEIYYIMENKKKSVYYCPTFPGPSDQKKDTYLYDIQIRKLENTCEFKKADSAQTIRIEAANRRLFLYDIGTAINDLPWWSNYDSNLIIYRGPYLRKKISDVQQVWTVKQSHFDKKLCIADSKNRIAALDCSKLEESFLDFEQLGRPVLFKRRNVCIPAEFDCSKRPDSKSLSFSKIPKSPPTYFTVGKHWENTSRKNYAIWLSESSSTQTISPIVQIRFDPYSKKFSPMKAVEYGLTYLLYPVTIVLDVLTTPFVVAYVAYVLRDFDGFF